jgi:superfamily II DNA or RNA helicase
MKPSDLAVFTGSSRPAKPALISLFTLNTARRGIAQMIPRPRMMVVDECHRAASPENRRALAGLHDASLGLSATPRRQYDEWLDEVLVPALGPVIYEYGYKEAQEDGVIVPFDLANVEVSLLRGEEEQFAKLTQRIARLIRDGDQERLTQVLRRRARLVSSAALRVPAAVKLVEKHRGERCMVFHESIAAADEIVRRIGNRGSSAVAYHTGLGDVTRRENLRLYRRGVFDVLVTCRALDEGVNVPETTVGIIASATASVRQRIQRLGRVLRPSIGKHNALVYSIYATELERTRLARETVGSIGARSVRWMRLSAHV